MVGAIEFLRKAKAICENTGCHSGCPIRRECRKAPEYIDEAELVRKVMDYRLEDADGTNKN